MGESAEQVPRVLDAVGAGEAQAAEKLFELHLWRAPSWARIEAVERTIPRSQWNDGGVQLARRARTAHKTTEE
jgi:hypothetical protein